MHFLLLQTILALAASASARTLSMHSNTHHIVKHILMILGLDLTDGQVNLHEAAFSTTADNCYWDGTSPFCGGSCNTDEGYIACKTDGCGPGACCVTGYKKYCCKDACPTGLLSYGECPRSTVKASHPVFSVYPSNAIAASVDPCLQ